MDSSKSCVLRVQSYFQCFLVRLQIGIALLFLATAAYAQKPGAATLPGTTLSDERYGPDIKNMFDIVLPESNAPTPLVIYVHGGGFVQGDKSDPFRSRSGDIVYFLKNRVAFASLNYRFAKRNDSLGVTVCLKDIRTALQFIRHHAAKYNINKDLIACYGSSAGAGSSLYLAFHDDLALKGDTTLLGESTRLRCAGALATQATYDVFRWESFIPGMDTAMARAREKYDDAGANFYGYPNYRAFKPHKAAITPQIDMLQMISPDDPPIYIMNLQKETFPVDINTIQHHRAQALMLDDYLKRNHVEHEVYVYSDTTAAEKDIRHPVREFLVGHLSQGSGSGAQGPTIGN